MKRAELVMRRPLGGLGNVMMQGVRKAEHRPLVVGAREEDRRQIRKLGRLLVVSTALHATAKQADPALPACALSSVSGEDGSDSLVLGTSECEIYPCVVGAGREVTCLAGAPEG